MVRVHRHPFLYIFTLVVLLGVHAWLCYPAATCRGHPPLEAFWQFVAIYLAFLGVVIPPAFEDFIHFPAMRYTVLATFTVLACLILGVALANLNSARPHIGHLAGYWGVIRYDWPEVIFCAVASSAVAVPFVFCVESVARGFWSRLRQFPAAA